MSPNVSFPNRRNLAPSQQGEEQGVGLGGWVGGHVGMCRGVESVCEGRRHVSPGEHVSATVPAGWGLQGWWGKEPEETECAFVRVCVRR